MATTLTTRTLQSLKPGSGERSDNWARGGGTLTAWRRGEGVLFYFRYTKPDGQRDRVPLGEWDGSGGPLSLAAARARAQSLSNRYRAGDRDLRAILEGEEREAQREREAAAKALQAEQERQQATLGALLTAYADSLEAQGKSSARQVRATLRRHIHEAWPKLWATTADDLTADDLMPALTRLTDGGKLREAAKVRTYLQAAYGAGMRARTTASSTPALRALRIRTNPARDLGTIEGANKARDRALSLAELRAYWARIKALPDRTGACLRFHLLTGGQRLEQLARLTVADYDPERSTAALRDGKGNRSTPRLHVVPLIPEAAEAMHAMAPVRLGDYLFTATAGESGMAPETAHHRCKLVMADMIEAGELPGGKFSINDLRRTVETRLAEMGFHSDVRAQLQSHGLSGVQVRHYDRYDYLTEKREALEALYRSLTAEESAKVIPFPRSTTAA